MRHTLFIRIRKADGGAAKARARLAARCGMLAVSASLLLSFNSLRLPVIAADGMAGPVGGASRAGASARALASLLPATRSAALPHSDSRQALAVSVPSVSAPPVQSLPADIPVYLDQPDGGPVLAAEAAADAGIYHPHLWPVKFSQVGYISSGYGWRTDPVTGEGTEFHMAVDFADREGSKIYASAAGTVVERRYSEGLGQTLLVDHGNGYQTRYSHCSAILAKEGDTVAQGQIIALMGCTGRSTGSHCDFRVYYDGKVIDPMTVLDAAAGASTASSLSAEG